jgi:hypothetical protein
VTGIPSGSLHKVTIERVLEVAGCARINTHAAEGDVRHGEDLVRGEAEHNRVRTAALTPV